ncbi:MAG: tetratricopeptide repeat-containing diguanylate cyclase [Rubrivivax sp.]
MGLLLVSPASQAGAPAAPAAPGDSLAPRVLALERDGRAQPRAKAAELAALLADGSGDAASRLDALMVQGWLLASVPDQDAAEAVARQLDDVAGSATRPLASAAALWVRARLAEQTGDTRLANTLIDDAMARLPNDAAPVTRLRFVAAQAHIRNGASRLEDAIRLDHQALTLADALGLPWRQAEVRNDLAYSYFQAGQPQRARALNREAMDIALRDGDPMTLAHVSTVKGIILDGLGDSQGERHSLQDALDYARKAGARTDEALYLANLADFYLKRADYPTALRYAQQALPLTRELMNLGGQTVALANIGLAQIALRDIESGKRNLRASIDIDERRGSLTGVSDSYAEMGQYLERAGDFRGAIDALHQHRALSDQILKREQQQAILEMQEQFDSERRTRELELLRRDGELKTEQLHARDLQQGLWWLIAACCVLTVSVVLMLMRRVRQTNQQLATSNAMLQEQAGIDPLTGLANRRHFQAAMRRLAADGKFSGTVLLADLDHFKRINDQHGHGAGDAVLVEVAQRLRAVLREADLIVRWGGEEFLVVVRALGADAVQTLAQRMLDVIGGTPFDHEGRELRTTVSIGYATFPIEPSRLAVSWERAINLVDTALYLAKAHGRNRAYGLRMLHACDEPQLDAIGRSLEDAWRAGDVALTHLDGPANASAPADETVAEAA